MVHSRLVSISLASVKRTTPVARQRRKAKTHPPPQFAIFGSSHMRRTAVQLVAKGYSVMDLTQKSWFLNKKSVEALTNTLQSACIPADTFLILDLFGNTSTKFRQADDTLALATKVGGGGLAYARGGSRHTLRIFNGTGRKLGWDACLYQKPLEDRISSYPALCLWELLQRHLTRTKRFLTNPYHFLTHGAYQAKKHNNTQTTRSQNTTLQSN